MADENKPAFYPRVGRNIAKNFRSAQPAPFINDPRAMELPQYGDVDLSQPTKANLELGRRMTQRDADLKRQQSADTSPLEKAAGALQTVRLMGSALTQAINSLPTRIAKGDAAAEQFMQDRMYKPEQPLAYEYAGDVGEFLDRLETQYKLPPILPEAVALQFLTAPATSQAMRTAGRGAEQAGRAIERRMEPVVKGAFERGGLPREMVLAMGANTQSNVVKPKGGNWFDDNLNRSVQDLKKSDRGVPFSNEDVAYLEGEIERLRSSNLQNEMVQDNIRRLQGDLALNKQESALNNWLENTYKNYVKNEMATPEDRVRKMFDRRTQDVEKLEAKYEKDITKLETKLANAKAQPQSRERDQAIAYLERDIQDKIEDLNFDVGNAEKTIGHIRYLENEARRPAHGVISVREDRGFPTEGMATSTIGKGWENLTDSLLGMKKAGRIGRLPETVERYPWLEKVDPEAMVYKTMSDLNKDTGIDHVLDVLRQDVRSGAITPEQLSKITMDQAVERAANFDREAGVKMRQTAIKNTEGFPTYKEYPNGYKWIELAHLPEDVLRKKHEEYVRRDFPDIENYDPYGFEQYVKDSMHSSRVSDQKQLEDALKYEGDTMGHCVGSYCPDVVAGRSRIFSLRDRRGEPHVTVEVKPQNHLDYNTWFNKQPEEVQNRIAQRRLQDKNHDIYEGPEYLAAREALPPLIYQVKGKQNARPIEKYDPYTQDFVRSGNWDILGDFENTGLYKADPNELGMYLPMAEDLKDLPIKRSDLLTRAQQAGLFPEGQKYLNRNEWEDILRRQYQAENPPKPDVPPDLEGMRRGGKVSISNNPDTMMLELNNQKMAGGGAIAKLARAAPKSKAEIDAIARRMAPQMLGEFVRGRTGSQSVAEKTQKQFAREKEMVHDIRPTGAERGLPRTVDYEELKDNVMVGIAGDPTISGKTIYSVNGVPLESPSPQHGGPLYGLEHEGDAFWASGLNAANRVQNVAREASKQYDLPVLGNYVMMGPDSINYAQHYADANLAAINPAKMSRGQIEDFNKLVRQGSKKSGPRPSFPGIENPSEAYLHFSVDPELRKHFNALMQMPTVTQKYNLPSGVDIRHAVTEPDLRDLEIGVTGKSIGRLRPEVENLGYSEHPTYSHDIPGEFMGSSKYNIPYELSFPDSVKAVRENPKQAPQEFGSFKYVGPRQVIDQQLIDEIKQYQEMIKKYTGKKKGGGVKQPAAYIDGNEFVEAAQKYGIKDSMSNLNMIVNLVNKGLSVDDAARQVSDSGMHKAAGGAITGDDLILEERPL